MEIDAPYNMTGKKLFDFKLIGLGLIFLLDFNVNTIDILPDFIGLILISAGLGKAWYINENLSKAKNYINIFFLVSLSKFVWNIIYLLIDSEMFDSSLILLLTVIFSGFEFVLSILIFTDIFRAFEIFFQISGIISHAKKSDFILGLLKFFMFIKIFLAIISQVPVLITEESWDNLSMIFDLYLDADFVKNLLIPPCFIIQTLIGIFLLSLVLPFFFNIAKDKNLYDSIKSKINNMLINDNFFAVKQTLNFAFILFMAGCLFFMDFKIDGINIIPDFVICIIFMAGIFTVLMANPDIKNKKLIIYLVINFFVSGFSYITGIIYEITSGNSFSGENIKILNNLQILCSLSFYVSVILFFLIFIEFYNFIGSLQKKHLDFSVRYLNKYLTSSEKEFDRNKNIILRTAAAVFCVKILSPVLPQAGIILFFHAMILAVFVFFVIKGLYTIRDNIYSYYNNKNIKI